MNILNLLLTQLHILLYDVDKENKLQGVWEL